MIGKFMNTAAVCKCMESKYVCAYIVYAIISTIIDGIPHLVAFF